MWKGCGYHAKPWPEEDVGEYRFCLFHQDLISTMKMLEDMGVQIPEKTAPYRIFWMFAEEINKYQTERGLPEVECNYSHDEKRFTLSLSRL